MKVTCSWQHLHFVDNKPKYQHTPSFKQSCQLFVHKILQKVQVFTEFILLYMTKLHCSRLIFFEVKRQFELFKIEHEAMYVLCGLDEVHFMGRLWSLWDSRGPANYQLQVLQWSWFYFGHLIISSYWIYTVLEPCESTGLLFFFKTESQGQHLGHRVCALNAACQQSPEDNFWEPVLAFQLLVSSRNQTHIIRLVQQVTLPTRLVLGLQRQSAGFKWIQVS